MVRRAVLSGILAAALLVAVNATSAFAATTSDTTASADASSVSTSPITATPPADVASTTTTAAPATSDATKGTTSTSTQVAGDVQATALATEIAVVEHPDPPQPPLTDSHGAPLISSGSAGTPDGHGAVTYGGLSFTGAASSAASWVWDGTSWAQVCAVCAPGLRGVSGMATELKAPATGVLMYGGAAAYGLPALSDMWVFADGGWTQLCASCPPGARLGSAMAGGGPAGDEVLLFGGASDFTGNPGTLFNDTWGFDGTTWTLLDAGVGGDPVPRVGASIAWDGARFILLGGAVFPTLGAAPIPIDDGTWAWAGDHWTQLCANAAACGPAPRIFAASAALGSTDPSRRGVLLVGGLGIFDNDLSVRGDIWFWHAGQWIQQVSPWLDQQPFYAPTGPLIVNAGVASLSALCQVGVVGPTLTGVSTFHLGLDTNGDGVIDPCPVLPPPAPPTPTPTPENAVAPAAATAGTGGEATAAGTLPFTGSDLAGPMSFATALLGVGLILVAGSRRTRVRRRASS
jgi:hypothetical protein